MTAEEYKYYQSVFRILNRGRAFFGVEGPHNTSLDTVPTVYTQYTIHSTQYTVQVKYTL